MVLNDVQFLNTLKGKRVKLTLKTSSYLGVVQRINPNKTLILTDVVSGSNGVKCPGSKMFFGHEILNVEFTNEANATIGNIHDHQFEEHLNVERFQPYKKTITFDKDDEEYINFVVIDEFQEMFGSAVMHIKKQHVIGVGTDGVEVFKHGRLCWLQIATKRKVYLFDILILGARAFKNGLSMILENKHILKVIHDCRAIAGCLIAQFGVKLTNVFDTQVADVMCFYSETGGLLPDRVSTLQEVVSLHLKVPSSQLLSLQMMSQLTKEELEMCYERPCPLPLLKVMALSVIHLQPLRLVLLDTIMTDYMAMVDSYLNSSHFQPGELEHVGMESVLELPRELRQLEQTRRERQKWAADHYPVTEEGLLARFNPRSQTPSQPTLVTENHGQTQVESFEPENVESPSQVDTLLHKLPLSPPRVNNVLSVDIHASPDPQGTASDLTKEPAVTSPLSLGVGRGRTEVLMDTMGRGRPFGKEQSSIPALPAIGRGFLLQISQDQIPRESMGDITAVRMGVATLCPYNTHTQEGMSEPGPSVHDLPKDTSGMTGEQFRAAPKSVPSSLTQSFMSFRY
ncbi:piRNA biogenesis protein EXD1 isoform X2 [Etheostoma cragini]|uniref:piRNA biogenesis protein EXD1 isoform X2 n=1 Tax=Etheostoma cragini TaxID=417921 RepID=UPI00155E6D22|nr:piRNA biogenesis protein EXD1 isoform X2 [Etheostoma cragini]